MNNHWEIIQKNKQENTATSWNMKTKTWHPWKTTRLDTHSSFHDFHLMSCSMGLSDSVDGYTSTANIHQAIRRDHQSTHMYVSMHLEAGFLHLATRNLTKTADQKQWQIQWLHLLHSSVTGQSTKKNQKKQVLSISGHIMFSKIWKTDVETVQSFQKPWEILRHRKPLVLVTVSYRYWSSATN